MKHPWKPENRRRLRLLIFLLALLVLELAAFPITSHIREKRLEQKYAEEARIAEEEKAREMGLLDYLSQDTVSISADDQKMIDQFLDTLLVKVHSDSIYVRLNAMQVAMELTPTLVFNDLDSLAQNMMLDKLNRIVNEWNITKLENGNYWLSKEIIIKNDFISIDVIIDRATRECKRIAVGFPAKTEQPYLCFFKDSFSDESKEIRIDSMLINPETQSVMGFPEVGTFDYFLDNKTLLISYFTEGTDSNAQSVILWLDYLHRQYEELLDN